MKKLFPPALGFFTTASIALGNPTLPQGLTLEPGGVIRSHTQEDHVFEVEASSKSTAMNPMWFLDITMETGAAPGSIQVFVGNPQAPDVLFSYTGGSSLQRTARGGLPADATPAQGALRLVAKIHRGTRGMARVEQTVTTGGTTTRTRHDLPVHDAENLPLNAWDSLAIRIAGDASVRVEYKILTQGTLLMVR